MGKYGAVRENGFASKLEASVAQLYHLRELAKEIQIIQCQKHVKLSRAEITYIADFELRDLKTGEVFYGEAKGYETPEWRLKRRLWLSYGPGRLEIWKGTHKAPFLYEVIGTAPSNPPSDYL